MSTTNQPNKQSAAKKQSSSAKSEKKDSSKTILIVLAAVFAASTAFFGWQFGSTKSDLSASQASEKQAIDAKTALQQELAEQLKQLESLKGDNAEMNERIDALKKELLEAQNSLADYKDLGDIDQLRRYKSEFFRLKKEVNQMRKRVQALEEENQMLTNENTGLKSNLNQEKNKNATLTDENFELIEQVNKGSMLLTQQITVDGVRMNMFDTEKIKTSASKVEKLRICFTLAPNRLATKGSKKVYVRVVGPNDNVLTTGGNNFRYQGKSIAYSSMDEIEYNGESQDVCIRVKNPVGDFESGSYNAKIYCDGNLIGEQSVRLD